MNLEDLVDDKGLQQDEWSLMAPTFGKDNQLTVVGWSGRTKLVCGAKFYILLCNTCKLDRELFGDGVFRSAKSDLVSGGMPCGCALSPKWSREQYSVLCTRAASEKGHTFISFIGEWRAQNTKVKLLCTSHGVWESGTIANLINKRTGCPGCKAVSIGEYHTKPDDVMIESFLDSGGFADGTTFWRSDRLTSKGYKEYWYVSCTDCSNIGEATSTSLRLGARSCLCSKHRQQEGYINLLFSEDITVAIKFGIATDSLRRVKQTAAKTAYKVVNHSVYSFHSADLCKKAERECKQELECGVVLKRDMLDGYTETTWAYNLEKVIEIYERNGGVRVEYPTDYLA